MSRTRRGAADSSLGLDELMIVNPIGRAGGTGMLLGSDGGVYRVRMGAADAGRWFLGDDGALYERARSRQEAPPRWLLGADGALYAVEWTKRGAPAGLGCSCGVRTACPCMARTGRPCAGHCFAATSIR